MNGIEDMENNEKCLIEQTKKLRVGGTGPRRQDLVTFKKIATLTEPELQYLLKLVSENTGNDLGSEEYSISKHCNYLEVFNANENYRQILLQRRDQNTNGSAVDEYLYTEWAQADMLDNLPTIKELFKHVYRFRISVMKGNHELNWHIDTDPSVICRAQICLNDAKSTFEFKTKTEESVMIMKPGDVFFINTGWNHRVVNSGDTERMVAIFGFHFDDLEKNISNTLRVGERS